MDFLPGPKGQLTRGVHVNMDSQPHPQSQLSLHEDPSFPEAGGNMDPCFQGRKYVGQLCRVVQGAF